MILSEFIKLTPENQYFYLKKAGEAIDGDEELLDRNDLEFGEYADCELVGIDTELIVTRSCSYMVDIVIVLFIKVAV